MAETADHGPLSEIGRHVLETLFVRAWVVGYRVLALLRNFDCVTYRYLGQWRSTSSCRDAYEDVMNRFGERATASEFAPGSPFLAVVHEWRTRQFVKKHGFRNPIVYTSIKKHFTRLAQAVSGIDSSVPQCGFEKLHKLTWADADLLKTHLAAQSPIRSHNFSVGLDAKSYRRAYKATARLLDSVPEPIARTALQVIRQPILSQVAGTEGAATWLQRLFKQISPRAILLASVQPGLYGAIAWAGQKNRKPVALVGHCSVGDRLMKNRMSARALHSAYADLTASRFADIQVVQSPHAERVSRELAPSARRLRARPIIWNPGTVSKQRSTSGKFRILHAGNFQPWQGFEPYRSETGTDYIRCLTSLAEAILKAGNIELVVRFKKGNTSKEECLPSTIRANLPQALQYEISEKGSFYDELAKADLLVSSYSTVIEEALHNRIPVLLHTRAEGGLFCDTQTTLPGPAQRSAVYSSSPSLDLAELLCAIATAHHGIPLSDEEIEPHTFPADDPDLHALAELLTRDGLK